MVPEHSGVFDCWIVDLKPHYRDVVWVEVVRWCWENLGPQKSGDVWLWNYQTGTIFLYVEEYTTAFSLRWS